MNICMSFFVKKNDRNKISSPDSLQSEFLFYLEYLILLVVLDYLKNRVMLRITLLKFFSNLLMNTCEIDLYNFILKSLQSIICGYDF